ncbi:MAG: DUF29 family protein [Phormidesmis sp.]
MLKLKSLYESDFNLWIEAQIKALLEQRLEQLDITNLIAAAETGLEIERFPERCPYPLSKVLETGFLP